MNSPARYKNSGFTLIELLLVIAIVAILGSMTTPFLSRFVLKTHFDAATQKMSSSFHKAQSYAMNGKNGDTWGVCMNQNVLVLYSGTCSTPSSTENYTFPSTITVSGFTDVQFDLRGEPSSFPTITVASSIDTKVFIISEAGGIQ